MSESLQDKTINNAIWVFLGRFGSLIIGFIGNLVLARLLSPDDYGCFGLLLVFTSIADILVDSGLGMALVQKKNITSIDCSTVFVSNMVLSIILSGLLIIMSPYIADYFGMPILQYVLQVESLAIIIRALYIIPVALISKKLELKKIAIANTVAAFFSTLSAISFAYYSMGVWSLVAKNIGLQLALCIFYWINFKYKISIKFSKESFKQLFGYGGFLTLASLLESFFSNISTFIMGKKFSVTSVGYYSQANSIGQIPIFSLSSIAIQTLFPTLAILQDDKKIFKIGVKKAVKTMTFIATPLIVILILLSEPAIVFLYTDKWINAVPFLQLICLRGLINPQYHINMTILKSLGKSKLVSECQFIIGVLRIILMLIGSIYGIIGFLLGDIIGFIIGWILLVVINGKSINYGLLQQIKDMLPYFIVVMSLYACFYLMIIDFIESNLLKLIIFPITFSMFYLMISYMFKLTGIELLTKLLKKISL